MGMKLKPQKMKIKVSPNVDNPNFIRLGKKAREALGVTLENPYVELWSNPFENSALCTVKKAISNDLTELDSEKRGITCFVNETFTKNNLYNSKILNNDIWASTKKGTCIGSDPEFLIFSKKEMEFPDSVIVPASSLLSFEDSIGNDGNLGELRAAPGTDAKEHVENLDTLIKGIYNIIDPELYKCKIFPFSQCKMRYTGNNRSFADVQISCGGHVHLGLSKRMTNTEYIRMLIIDLLDRTIAVCLHRLDGDLGRERRNRLSYGNKGDYRTENGGYRLEWRTLSGSWLLYKDLAEIVLCVIDEFVEVITYRISKYFGNENIENNTFTNEKLLAEFVTKELFPELSGALSIDSDKVDYLLCDLPTDCGDFKSHIETILEEVSQVINSEQMNPFSKIVLADEKSYKNIEHDFIENWVSKTSVFDHMQI